MKVRIVKTYDKDANSWMSDEDIERLRTEIGNVYEGVQNIVDNHWCISTSKGFWHLAPEICEWAEEEPQIEKQQEIKPLTTGKVILVEDGSLLDSSIDSLEKAGYIVAVYRQGSQKPEILGE